MNVTCDQADKQINRPDKILKWHFIFLSESALKTV